MSENNSHLSGLADLVSQLQAFSKAVNANFQLQEVMSTMLGIRQKLIDSLEPVLQSQTRTSNTVSNIASNLAEINQSLLFDFRNQVENLVSPALTKIWENIRILPAHTQAALLILGNHGWFFDLNMPLPFLWELEKTLDEGNIEDAESALVNYFQGSLSTIEQRLNEKFPHRAKIVNAAFSAHRREEYELSIPVFLAQTDGICYEIISQHLFMRKNKKPSTAIYVDSFASDTLQHALLSPLSHSLPISASGHDRDEYFNELNRHQVLHGESLDYGTEINSLKSISFLNYVTQFLRLDDEDKT